MLNVGCDAGAAERLSEDLATPLVAITLVLLERLADGSAKAGGITILRGKDRFWLLDAKEANAPDGDYVAIKQTARRRLYNLLRGGCKGEIFSLVPALRIGTGGEINTAFSIIKAIPMEE